MAIITFGVLAMLVLGKPEGISAVAALATFDMEMLKEDQYFCCPRSIRN